MIAFYSLYLYSIPILANLWANLIPGSCRNTYHYGTNLPKWFLQWLEKSLRRMGNYFLGLGEEQELHILELNSLSYMLRLFVLGLNLHSQIFTRLKNEVHSFYCWGPLWRNWIGAFWLFRVELRSNFVMTIQIYHVPWNLCRNYLNNFSLNPYLSVNNLKKLEQFCLFQKIVMSVLLIL